MGISVQFLHPIYAPRTHSRVLVAFSCSGKIMKLNGIAGRDERIRTSDPLNPIQVRYQAALRPDALIVHHLRRGVNPCQLKLT